MGEIRTIKVDYEISCDKCDGKAMLKDLGSFGYYGKNMCMYQCKKCKKIIWKWA